eukprot:TRINITY_DN5671_c0_g1_i1.p1 TRINITY_DN5671_c0_g1~~TRINITY_DN5671_c0_g1_i1.p1  ORF type:complete len:856 (-),score=120.02 TRINITY_DN5671_c0_g1_i1:78-2645(-)
MEQDAGGGGNGAAVVRPLVVSVGCNRNAHAAAWSHFAHQPTLTGLVAYGAQNMVALYCPSDYAVKHTLRGHQDRVNAVAWINDKHVVSASSDTTLIVWSPAPDYSQWEASATLKGHTGPVTSVSTITWPVHGTHERAGEVWVASTSADKTVRIWRKTKEGAWDTHFVVQLAATTIMECCSFTLLPTTTPIVMLAIGGVDTLIHLYVSKGGPFVKLVALEGHEDWIRSLAFMQSDEGDVFLASSAQDNYIRLWKMALATTASSTGEKGVSPEDENDDDDDDADPLTQQRGINVRLDDKLYNVSLESVLFGHEDWVYSVAWHPVVVSKEGKLHQPLQLLSASMDRTMMVWAPEASGVWLNKVRVGEIGGNTLGFFGGLWGPAGEFILAHGHNGAFHLWQKKQASADKIDIEDVSWEPEVTVSGHFDEVMDLSWDPSGSYFVSVSKDQTSRLFAPWTSSKPATGSEGATQSGSHPVTWHELARPQIHGYDMSCLAFVNGANHRFVSGADEKVLRLFDAPQTYLLTLEQVAGVKSDLGDGEKQNVLEGRAVGANVPPLGLSNKPMFSGDAPMQIEDDGFNTDLPTVPTVYEKPPFEEHLLQNTLWPETQKLYGHGDYLVCASSNHKGTHVASACKGTQTAQCAVIVWDVTNWRPHTTLPSHNLTVTQLEYSHNDKYLLSVSRDRAFTLWRIDQESGAYTTVTSKQKAHERIIWGAAWSPDDAYFATGSRDKKVKVWKKKPGQEEGAASEQWVQDSVLTFKSPVTAVSWMPLTQHVSGWAYLLAVGLENGLISLWTATLTGEKLTWASFLPFPPTICHVGAVRRLRWRQQRVETLPSSTHVFEVASCALDHSVRLFQVSI